MAREPNIGQSPGAIVKTATKAVTSVSPGGIIKTILAELIAEHGYDAVKYVFEKLRPGKKPATSGSGGAAFMLALVALGAHRRGGKRHRR